MKRVVLVCAWLSISATVVGFFLPWARIDVRESASLRDTVGGLTKGLGRVTVKIRRGTETIAGDLPSLSDIPKQVSGAQIPQMANEERAQVTMALVELFTQTRQHLGAKSYAVYLVPGITVLCGVLLAFLNDQLAVTAGIAGCCAAIAGFGSWKLLTTNTQTLFVAITIGEGLWLSLWGYVGLAIAATGLSVRRRERP